MTEIMPVPRNSHITVLRPPSIIAAFFLFTALREGRKEWRETFGVRKNRIFFCQKFDPRDELDKKLRLNCIICMILSRFKKFFFEILNKKVFHFFIALGIIKMICG